MNEYNFVLLDDIKNNNEIDLISAFKELADIHKEEKLMARNNKKEEVKVEDVPVVEETKVEEAPAEEVKAEAPVEEVKAEASAEEVKVEAAPVVEETKVEETTVEEVKNTKEYPPVQKGKKRVNVYADGRDLTYITYPFTGVKKGIVLDLEDIKKLCWHEVPVEEIKADGTVVKLTLENYDK